MNKTDSFDQLINEIIVSFAIHDLLELLLQLLDSFVRIEMPPPAASSFVLDHGIPLPQHVVTVFIETIAMITSVGVSEWSWVKMKFAPHLVVLLQTAQFVGEEGVGHNILVNVPGLGAADLDQLPVVVHCLLQVALEPDDLLPGAASGSYEGHHEGVAVHIGQLISPDPDLHIPLQRFKNLRSHDECIHISSDHYIIITNDWMIVLSHDSDQLRCEDTGQSIRHHNHNICSITFQPRLVLEEILQIC